MAHPPGPGEEAYSVPRVGVELTHTEMKARLLVSSYT